MLKHSFHSHFSCFNNILAVLILYRDDVEYLKVIVIDVLYIADIFFNTIIIFFFIILFSIKVSKLVIFITALFR